MSATTISAGVDGGEPKRPTTAGAMLVAGRETAGLSIDDVANQLKLAPRQIKALEDGDYNRLPGRTFVRGFVKSYARLVRLDPELVVGALPAGAVGALEAPRLHPTAPTIGELPITDHSKPSWTRWAIPVTLAAIVGAAAAYEWLRPAGSERASVDKDAAINVERPTPAISPPVSGKFDTPLPNPLAVSTPSSNPSATPIPTAAGVAAIESTTVAAPSVAITSVATPSVANNSSVPATPTDQPLALAFRDYSWTEVRDRDGRVLLSGMNSGGTERSLSGNPPLEIIIGNASDVSLTYRGQPVDLVPYTRQNVARLSLP